MATYKALVNFSGNVSMHVGEVKDISDVNIAKDLLRAGYMEEVKQMNMVNYFIHIQLN